MVGKIFAKSIVKEEKSSSNGTILAFVNIGQDQLNRLFLKIKYVTQVHHSPPILAFYTNHPDLFPIAYKRYLENQLRKTFDLKGVPIRISFRHK